MSPVNINKIPNYYYCIIIIIIIIIIITIIIIIIIIIYTTEWSSIRSVIIWVIPKSDDCAAEVRFVNHQYNYKPISATIFNYNCRKEE